MSSPVRSTSGSIEPANAPSDDAPKADAAETAVLAAVLAADTDETVSIELDFNAFADHVPPTQHARRVAMSSDPSVQDFADQALEIAALRAELKRLTRDYDVLQHTLRVREMRLQTLQQELSALRSQSRGTKHVAPPPVETPPVNELSRTLELSPKDAEATATIVEAPAVLREEPAAKTPTRRLIPVDHEGEAIPLSRDIMTIGRTKENDICIPSRAVSRDHARLVVSARSVTVIDMHSANGCFVNDQPVKRHKLRESDVLRIADRSFRYAAEVPGT